MSRLRVSLVVLLVALYSPSVVLAACTKEKSLSKGELKEIFRVDLSEFYIAEATLTELSDEGEVCKENRAAVRYFGPPREVFSSRLHVVAYKDKRRIAGGGCAMSKFLYSAPYSKSGNLVLRPSSVLAKMGGLCEYPASSDMKGYFYVEAPISDGVFTLMMRHYDLATKVVKGKQRDWVPELISVGVGANASGEYAYYYKFTNRNASPFSSEGESVRLIFLDIDKDSKVVVN